jgi:putative membrane protein
MRFVHSTATQIAINLPDDAWPQGGRLAVGSRTTPGRQPGVLRQDKPISRSVSIGEDSMIANYTNHAANERTFLAWIRSGLAVAAFGFFLVKLNVLVEAVDGAGLPHLPAQDAGAFVAAAARYAGLATVVVGIVIIARSGVAFERTRRAINRDEVVEIPQSGAEPLLSAALAIAVFIFCIYLAVL